MENPDLDIYVKSAKLRSNKPELKLLTAQTFCQSKAVTTHKSEDFVYYKWLTTKSAQLWISAHFQNDFLAKLNVLIKNGEDTNEKRS